MEKRSIVVVAVTAIIVACGVVLFFRSQNPTSASAPAHQPPAIQAHHFAAALPIGLSYEMFKSKNPTAHCSAQGDGKVMCVIGKPDVAACPAFVPCKMVMYVFRKGEGATLVSGFYDGTVFWFRLIEDVKSAYGSPSAHFSEGDSLAPKETWEWQRPEGILIFTRSHSSNPSSDVVDFTVAGDRSIETDKPIRDDHTLGFVFPEGQSMESFLEEQPGSTCSTDGGQEFCMISRPITPQCPGLRPCSRLFFSFSQHRVQGYMANYDCGDWQSLMKWEVAVRGTPERSDMGEDGVRDDFIFPGGRVLWFVQQGQLGHSSLKCVIGFGRTPS